MTEEQLSALLRIKRFEQPPPQYFDRLLQNIHRQQRAELLRRPLWKIAADRFQTFFSEHSMGHLSYAGALATMLVVGVVGIGLVTSGGPSEIARAGTRIAQNTIAAPESRLLSLQQTAAPQPVLESPTLPSAQSGYQPVSRRYIIDARPASYEPAASYLR